MYYPISLSKEMIPIWKQIGKNLEESGIFKKSYILSLKGRKVDQFIYY
jgi:hypothetical protein